MDTLKFARKCSATGEGMNEGWICNDGDAYFKYENDAIEWCNKMGYDSLEDAFDDDAIYYTEWDASDIEEDELDDVADDNAATGYEFHRLFISPEVAEQISSLVLDDIQTEGGSSRSFRDLSKPESGYMVSFRNPTLIMNQPVSMLLSVRKFVDEAKTSGEANENTYLGGWRDKKTGLTHIDISVNIPELSSALVLAKAMGQIAIYDVVAKDEIRL